MGYRACNSLYVAPAPLSAGGSSKMASKVRNRVRNVRCNALAHTLFAALGPTFKGSDCTDRFCTLRALHTMRNRAPARHRAGGDGLGHHTPARPRDRLSIIGPVLPGQTRIAPPPPSVSLSRLCSLAPAGPGYGDTGAPAAE